MIHFEETIHDKRAANKMGLDTYSLNDYNMYDIAIDQLISTIKANVAKSNEEINFWDELKEKDPARYEELYDELDRADSSPDMAQRSSIEDLMHDEEQLLALMEAKIIYAFKSMEISMKNLIKAAFTPESTSGFFKWENLAKYLKEKHIDVRKVNGYEMVNQLRLVNNVIKHSGEFDQEVRKIPEFQNAGWLSFRTLEAFYNRVKDAPLEFIRALLGAIGEELYEFDDDKLEAMAIALVLRLEKADALKLTEKIIGKYDCE